MKQLTQQRVCSLFSYEKETGILSWMERPLSDFKTKKTWMMWNKRFAGKAAGSLAQKGYIHIHFDGKVRKAHQIVWVMFNGSEADGEIDHINGVRNDNRIENLRFVTHSINTKNQRMHKTNTSGHVGVYWEKRNRKWKASIVADGRRVSLGYHKEIECAIAARIAAQKRFGFHPNHGVSQ